VPVERIELPTFGLQNRCSTAELNRLIRSNNTIDTRNFCLLRPASGGAGAPSNTRLVRQGLQPQTPVPEGLARNLRPDATLSLRESDRPRGSNMATRLRPLVVSIVSAFLVSGWTAAHAADPGFCRQYARAALNQVRSGLANPRCATGLHGSRWSSDFAVPYEWCLGVSLGAAGDERVARARYLRSCR
jgi:hypothetical protein